MSVTISINIRIKDLENEEPIQIHDLGNAEDFYFLLTEGKSHNLNFNLPSEVLSELKKYNVVEDSTSPMREDTTQDPDYRKPQEIMEIIELIQRNVLQKLRQNEIILDDKSQVYLLNLFLAIGGLMSICYYAKELEQKIAIVYICY